VTKFKITCLDFLERMSKTIVRIFGLKINLQKSSNIYRKVTDAHVF